MLSSSKQIQKQKRYRDHGNSTMTKDQRNFVKKEIQSQYKDGIIKNSRHLKDAIIRIGNEYHLTTNLGKPITELKKSTFYDFLRENEIPLPKNFKDIKEDMSISAQQSKSSDKLPSESESIKLKIEERTDSLPPEKPNMVSVETQTDNNNLFQYIFMFNRFVLVPLKPMTEDDILKLQKISTI